MASKFKQPDPNVENKYTPLVYKLNAAHARYFFACKTWLVTRTNSINELKSLADDIDKHHRNVNIVTLSATSVSALGGVAIITGLLFAPVTAGISATLAIGGSIAQMVGGAAAIGSTLAKMGLTQQRCKVTQAYIDLDKGQTKLLIEEENKFEQLLSDELGQLISSATDTDIMEITSLEKEESFQKVYALLIKTLGSCVVTACNMKPAIYQMIKNRKFCNLVKLSETEMQYSLKGSYLNPARLSTKAKIITGSLTAVFTVVDIWMMVQTAIDMFHGSKSEHGNSIRETILELEKGRQDINAKIKEMD